MGFRPSPRLWSLGRQIGQAPSHVLEGVPPQQVASGDAQKFETLGPGQGARVGTVDDHRSVESVEDIEGGVRMTFSSQMEIEGQSRPALVAETISLAYD